MANEEDGGADGQLEASRTGLEADADALEEEIEQMRVNKRVEARFLQGRSLIWNRLLGQKDFICRFCFFFFAVFRCVHASL